MKENGKFHRQQNSLSWELSGNIPKTPSLAEEQSLEVTSQTILSISAEEQSQCLQEHSILRSDDCGKKATLSIRKVLRQKVVVEESIISLPTKENESILLPVKLLKDSSLEESSSLFTNDRYIELTEKNRRLQEDKAVAEALESSPIIKWGLYPLSSMLGQDEPIYFRLKMLKRKKLVEGHGYPKWFIYLWDLGCLTELIWRYITTSIR